MRENFVELLSLFTQPPIILSYDRAHDIEYGVEYWLDIYGDVLPFTAVDFQIVGGLTDTVYSAGAQLDGEDITVEFSQLVHYIETLCGLDEASWEQIRADTPRLAQALVGGFSLFAEEFLTVETPKGDANFL